MAAEDYDTIATYWDVIREMARQVSGEPDPKDGAATLRAMAQKHGG